MEELEDVEELEEAEKGDKEKLPYEETDVVVDLEETLENFMGKKDVVSRVIESFIKKVKEQLVMIDSSVESRDFESLRGEAHSIKGGGLNLAAVRLGKTAAALEQAAVNEEAERAEYLISLLHTEFEQFINESRKQL